MFAKRFYFAWSFVNALIGMVGWGIWIFFVPNGVKESIDRDTITYIAFVHTMSIAASRAIGQKSVSGDKDN